jgi:flagellar capping protein FliD
MWFVNIKKAYKSTNHYFLATNAINESLQCRNKTMTTRCMQKRDMYVSKFTNIKSMFALMKDTSEKNDKTQALV